MINHAPDKWQNNRLNQIPIGITDGDFFKQVVFNHSLINSFPCSLHFIMGVLLPLASKRSESNIASVYILSSGDAAGENGWNRAVAKSTLETRNMSAFMKDVIGTETGNEGKQRTERVLLFAFVNALLLKQ